MLASRPMSYPQTKILTSRPNAHLMDHFGTLSTVCYNKISIKSKPSKKNLTRVDQHASRIVKMYEILASRAWKGHDTAILPNFGKSAKFTMTPGTALPHLIL